MKKLCLILFFLFFSFSGEVSASSSAKSVVETQVESSGETQVYQSVETTVDGQTVKKESDQPGKLELEMKKEGEGEPTVSFSQEEQTSFTPTPLATGSFSQPSQPGNSLEKFWQDLTNPVAEFVKNLLVILTSWF